MNAKRHRHAINIL